MKRLIFAGLVCAAALISTHASAPSAYAFPPQCAAVTCLPCPEGTVAAPRPNDCCRCIERGA